MLMKTQWRKNWSA